MLKLIGKLLNIYEEEIGLFLWSALLFFLIRNSNILFNNFAETAFLKRYGVEYLPIVYMVNSISTFFIMGFLTGLMKQMPGSRLLAYMLLIFGSIVAGLRFLIPLGFDLLYPVLFVLKSQFEVLLALVFWNLANDLFNTRQSKRIFPLITGGGVLGAIIGSFGTPFLAKAITLDNLMLVYLIISVLGAITVKKLGNLYPTILIDDKKTKKKGSRLSIIEEFKKVLPLIKESKLLKILIMITLMPNILIPIMNYQFNFAIDQTFATEGKMLEFFGYFRGILNIISLIILLFVGRIYGRLGLPVALMFHPFNYMLAFIAFLLRFDIFSAMYARISTNVLRTTINNPARAVLMGLFPKQYRIIIMPFLRGTIVRIGVLAGSGFIMLSEGLIHPRYLSIIGILFGGLWLASNISLKRSYSKILSDLISKDLIDLKAMEETEINHIFGDGNLKSKLIQSFLSAQNDDCLWYAHLLKSIEVKNLDGYILQTIEQQDDKTKTGLISLLSPEVGEKGIEILSKLVDPEKPDLTIAIFKTINKIPVELCMNFNIDSLEVNRYPEIRGYTAACLYNQDTQRYETMINAWLDSDNLNDRKAGVIAAGVSGKKAFIMGLTQMVADAENTPILHYVFEGLHNLETPDLNSITLGFLSHPTESVRLSALEIFTINDDETLKTVIQLMGDQSDRVSRLAKAKIEIAPYFNPQILVESLGIPRRIIREGIFDLLQNLDVKDLDFFNFARSEIQYCYGYLAESEAWRSISDNKNTKLIIDYLNQEMVLKIENILRVLAAQDRSGDMRFVCRGVFSKDPRQRANSYEALDNILNNSLSKIMLPLLEVSSPSQILATGKKNFPITDLKSDDPSSVFTYFLAKEDWLTLVLTLFVAGEKIAEKVSQETILKLTQSENIHIRQMAQQVLENREGYSSKMESDMEKESTIPDKILYLKEVEIFKDLSVRELSAIASVTEEVSFPKGEIVIREGDQGETMYLIIRGEVSVIKGLGTEHQIELDRIGEGDYFGEMSLFEDIVRSAAISTEQETRLLVLHKQEFKEIVREYPQIALHICKVLSGRIRRLHKKFAV